MRSEFEPGEVLVRRQYRDARNPFASPRWVLEDSLGTVLTWMKHTGSGVEIILGDGTRYYSRSGGFRGRSWFKVMNPMNNEPLLQTRWGQRTVEPIKFRGHDLNYSIRRIEGLRVPWRQREGDNVLNHVLTITDGPVAALTITTVKNGKKNRLKRLPNLGHAVVGEDALGPDTPLIASVGLVLFDRSISQGGGG
jgi:hypothetical protein